jgi:putative ABC transport system permease protein
VLLMVVIPTFGMTVAATALRTSEWTAEDRVQAEVGGAEWFASPRGGGGTLPTDGEATLRAAAEREGRLLAHFPTGDVVVEHAIYDRIRTEDDRAYVQVSDVDLLDPIVSGRYTDLRGRVASGPGEVVLTSTLADELDLEIGDTVRPQHFGDDLTIVGLIDRVLDDQDMAFVGMTLFPDHRVDETSALVDDESSQPGTPPRVEGWRFTPTEAFWLNAGESNTGGVFWTYLGGAVALLVLGTVIAAAFAVGARRQLRSIGLLSASGASPRTVRWFLIAQGAVGGFVGAALGVGAAYLAVRSVPEAWLEEFIDRRIDGPVTRLADVVPIVAIGTVAAMGAAWMPARSAARVPTLQALAGRRPQARVPRRLPLLGATAVVGGCGLLALAVASREADDDLAVLVAVAGSVAVLVGTLAIGPWIVAALERLSGRLPESGRLAGRSLARSRLRSSAVVGAIVAVTATLVAGTSIYRTFDAEDDSDGREVPYVAAGTVSISASGSADDIAERAREATSLVSGANLVDIPRLVAQDPGERARPVFIALPGGTTVEPPVVSDGAVAVATPDVRDLYAIPADLQRALDEGAAIAVGPFDDVDRITLLSDGGESVELPFAGTFDSPVESSSLPSMLVGEGTADQPGLDRAPRPLLVIDVGRTLTHDEQERLNLYADDLSWEAESERDPQISFSFPEGPPALTPAQVRALGYGAILLLVGAVVAIGLALAARDDREEARVLSAVGAPPRVLRRVASLKAALLVVTAVAIAVPTGLLVASSIVAARWSNLIDVYDGYHGIPPSRTVHVDGPTLVFVVLVAPVATLLATQFLGWLRDVVRRPRPDVFVFAD